MNRPYTMLDYKVEKILSVQSSSTPGFLPLVSPPISSLDYKILEIRDQSL